MRLHRYLVKPSMALWLAMIIVGVGIVVVFTANSSDLPNNIGAEIKEATERGEGSINISEIVKRAILEQPNRNADQVLIRQGFQEKQASKLDATLLKEHAADSYRFFEKIIESPTVISHWQAKVYLFYRNNQFVDVLAYAHFTSI